MPPLLESTLVAPGRSSYRAKPDFAAFCWAVIASRITSKVWALRAGGLGAVDHVVHEIGVVAQHDVGAVDVLGACTVDDEQVIPPGRPAMSTYLRSSM